MSAQLLVVVMAITCFSWDSVFVVTGIRSEFLAGEIAQR